MFFRPRDDSLCKLFGVGLDLHGWCRVATTAFHVQSWRPNCLGAKQHYLLELAATYKTIHSSNTRTALLLSPQHWPGCTTTLTNKPHIHPHKCSMKLSFNSYKWTLLRLFDSCPCLVFSIFYIVLICEQDSWHALNQSCELCPEWWEMWPWSLLRHFCVSFHLISLVWAVAFSVTSLSLQIHNRRKSYQVVWSFTRRCVWRGRLERHTI